MNDQQSVFLLAHGGGQLDPRVSVVLGCIFVAAGLWLIIKSFRAWWSNRPWGVVFFGIFWSAFGYAFLAEPLQLPGRMFAIQLLLWLVAVPVLMVPWLLWKLNRYFAASRGRAEIDSANEPWLPEERIRSQLRPGEKILWCGVPSPRSFRSYTIAALIFGLIPFSMGSLFLYMMGLFAVRNGGQWQMLPGSIIGGAVALGFVTLGIGCFLTPFKITLRLRDVVYALTDQRALVLTSPYLLWNPVPTRESGEPLLEFSPDQIRQYAKKWRDFGRTDVIFLSEWRGSGRRRTLCHFGFLGLEDPDEPIGVIQEYYLKSMDRDCVRQVSGEPS